MKTAIEKAGYTGKVVIGMDVAASEFYNDKDKTYDLNFKEEVISPMVCFVATICSLFMSIFNIAIPCCRTTMVPRRYLEIA